MLSVLRQRNFALLWCGGLISMTGDWLLLIGLPVYVYALTGSTWVTGSVFIAGFVPEILLGSVAGVFADRWDRRRTMLVSTLLQALALLPLLAVSSRGQLWLVYAVQVVASVLSQFFAPAENALLPRVVGPAPEDLLAANALLSLGANLARLVGSPLGGVVAALLGLRGIVLLDAASFLVAAALIAPVRVAMSGRESTRAPQPDHATPVTATSTMELTTSSATHDTVKVRGYEKLSLRRSERRLARPRVASGTGEQRSERPAPPDLPVTVDAVERRRSSGVRPLVGAAGGVWREWLVGLRLVRGERTIRAIFAITAIQQVAQGIFVVLFIVFVERVLRGTAVEVGWLRGVQAVGGLLGGAVIGAIGKRVAARRLIGASGILFGLICLAIWNAPLLFPAYLLSVALFVAVGIPGVGLGTGTMTLLQRSVDDAYRGRIFGAFTTMSALLQLCGMLLAGALGDRLGVLPLLDAQGALYVAAGLVALLFLPRDQRDGVLVTRARRSGAPTS